MALGSIKMKGFGLLLLAVLGAASPSYLREANTFPGLIARQDDPTASIDSCRAPCDLDTCGAGACSVNLKRRSIDGLDSLLDSFTSINGSNAYQANPRELSKRLWRFDTTSTTPVGDQVPTPAMVDIYLPAVYNHGEEPYFGDPLQVVTNPLTEAAASQQVVFGDKPFQIMSSAVHGCTVVVLVSNRAVWMAHLWEIYSNGRDNIHNPDAPNFVQRVLNFIQGRPVKRPNPDPKPYIAPQGPSPDGSLFNQDDDETQLIIASPRTVVAPFAPVYEERVKAMAKTFATVIGRKPKFEPVYYTPLNYDVATEKALENRSNRGMFLFQYDPNSDNKGKKSWRYFCEYRYRVKNLPTS